MNKKLVRYGLFLYQWLMVGYVVGTLLLLGPVQWINTLGRSLGWPFTLERLVMMVVIFGYVLGTGWVTWLLIRWLEKSNSFLTTSATTILVTLFALVTVWIWLNPAWMLGESTLESDPGQQFVFGSYPTARRIQELEERGFTAVVSLLHPAVVPFEPRLIKREKRRLRSSQLDFVHAPMLPWVGHNEQSLEKLRRLARNGTGKYYVHCYLGRDRVHLARRVIQQAGGSVGSGEGTSRVRLSRTDRLERGKVFELGDSVYLTPYPTREEFMAYIFNGTVRHVVTLMEPDRDSGTNWVERERRLMKRYNLPFSHRHLPIRPEYDPDAARRVAEYVRDLPRPVVVHDFLSDRNAPSAEAFVLAFRFEDLPPLPPSLFSFELERGPVRVFDVNRAVGPRPRPSEVGPYLAERGIRDVFYLGPGSSESLESLRQTVLDQGLDWHRASSNFVPVDRRTRSGGPWYLFGPGTDSVETTPRLREALAGFEGFPSGNQIE